MTLRSRTAFLFGAVLLAGCGAAEEAAGEGEAMQPFVLDAEAPVRTATSLGEVDMMRERPVPTGSYESKGVFAGKPKSSTTEEDGVVVEEFALGSGPVASETGLILLDWSIYTDDGIIVYSTTRPMRTDVDEKQFSLVPEYLALDRFVPKLAHPRVVEAVKGMKKGGARRVRIPPEMAFGSRYYQMVPWNSFLNVELEVHDVIEDKPGAEPKEAFEGEPLKTDTRDDGLVISVIREGEGRAAVDGDAVYSHLLGEWEDGRVFVNTQAAFGLFSYRIGRGPFDTWLGPSLLGAKPGELRKVTVPPELAYADNPETKDKHTWTLFIEIYDVRDPKNAAVGGPPPKKPTEDEGEDEGEGEDAPAEDAPEDDAPAEDAPAKPEPAKPEPAKPEPADDNE